MAKKKAKVSEQEKMDMVTLGGLLEENKALQAKIERLKEALEPYRAKLGEITHLEWLKGTVKNLKEELQALKGGGQAREKEPSKNERDTNRRLGKEPGL